MDFEIAAWGFALAVALHNLEEAIGLPALSRSAGRWYAHRRCVRDSPCRRRIDGAGAGGRAVGRRAGTHVLGHGRLVRLCRLHAGQRLRAPCGRHDRAAPVHARHDESRAAEPARDGAAARCRAARGPDRTGPPGLVLVPGAGLHPAPHCRLVPVGATTPTGTSTPHPLTGTPCAWTRYREPAITRCTRTLA